MGVLGRQSIATPIERTPCRQTTERLNVMALQCYSVNVRKCYNF